MLVKYNIVFDFKGESVQLYREADSSWGKPIAVVNYVNALGVRYKAACEVVYEHKGYTGVDIYMVTPIDSYTIGNPRWTIRNSIPDWGSEFDTYSLYIDGRYCFEYVDRTEEYERKQLVDWFIEHQPDIKQWQVDFICTTHAKHALLFLKASIEHEHD